MKFTEDAVNKDKIWSVCLLCGHSWNHDHAIDIGKFESKCPKCGIFTKEQLLQLSKIIQHSIDRYDAETHEVDYFADDNGYF